MKTLWHIVSFMAVVHLLGLVMFAGWLWQSGRLSRARLEQLRATFGPTVAQELVDDEAAAEVAESEREAVAEAQRRENPALSAVEQIRLTGLAAEQADQTQRRLEDRRSQLVGEVLLAARQLELKRQALEAERRRYDQGIVDLEQRKNDAQFAKAVKLLETQPPKIAKARIAELMQAGEVDQAVAYLDAMNQRSASRILAAFKGPDEGRLATELLERLRTHGVRPPEAEAERGASSDAEPLARAP